MMIYNMYKYRNLRQGCMGILHGINPANIGADHVPPFYCLIKTNMSVRS